MRRKNLCSNDNRAGYSDVSLKILLVCGKYLKNMMSYRYIPKDGLEHCGHLKRLIFIVRNGLLFSTAYKDSIHKDLK